MVDGLELLDLAFRIILDHDLQRPQHRHAPLRRLVEVLANAEIQHADIDHAVGLGHADALDEFAHRFRRHAAPLQTGNASACADRPSRKRDPSRTSWVSTRFDSSV